MCDVKNYENDPEYFKTNVLTIAKGIVAKFRNGPLTRIDKDLYDIFSNEFKAFYDPEVPGR